MKLYKVFAILAIIAVLVFMMSSIREGFPDKIPAGSNAKCQPTGNEGPLFFNKQDGYCYEKSKTNGARGRCLAGEIWSVAECYKRKRQACPNETRWHNAYQKCV